MIIVGDAIISEELLNVCFVCDFSKCLGHCCVVGDAGAPLTKEETVILPSIYQSIKSYLSYKSLQSIAKQGVYVKDFEGELTTPLMDNKHCVYAYFDDKKIARCAIEKAYLDGVINYQKPLSCHLYPVRITKNNPYDAVNYHRWHICEPARKYGENLNVPLFEFAKDALTRKYGNRWYEEFVNIAKEYCKK